MPFDILPQFPETNSSSINCNNYTVLNREHFLQFLLFQSILDDLDRSSLGDFEEIRTKFKI